MNKSQQLNNMVNMFKNGSIDDVYVARTVNAPWSIAFELRCLLQLKKWRLGDDVTELKKLLLGEIISVEPQPIREIREWTNWLAA